MFVDFRDTTPPPRWEPPRKTGPRLDARQQKLLGRILWFNLLMLLLGPLAGSSVVNGLVRLFGG